LRKHTGTPGDTATERRYDRRYRIALGLRWKLVRRRKIVDSGVGTTVDLSSGGLLFDAGRELLIGETVDVSISWPALLNNIAPMLLVVSGRIVRSARGHSAIRIGRHEFRTAGVPVQNPTGTQTFSASRVAAGTRITRRDTTIGG